MRIVKTTLSCASGARDLSTGADASGATGAISGSAVVKIIENNLDDKEKMLTELANFVSNMKSAT